MFEKERTYIKWKYLYYNGQTEVSDATFDKLEDELRNMGSSVVYIKDSPTLEILAKYNLLDELSSGEREIRFKHDFPMLSLRKFQVTADNDDNELFPSDIVNFFNKVPGGVVTCTPKFDGNSIELIYNIGGLSQALTRGNDDGGLDRTKYLKHIVPSSLDVITEHKDYKIVIRGEVIIPTDVWEKKWSDPTKVDNPRNWVAGILNSDDADINAIKDMHFIAYRISLVRDNTETNPLNQLDILENYGFSEIFHMETTGYDDFFANVYPKFKEYRANCQYLLDGIVLNFSPEYWDILGVTSHHPHYACAVKFPPNRAITYVENITWTLGKDGELTPKAVFKPIELDGTIVKHASLHNLGWIVDNNVFPGCKVEIAKKGEIIPQLVRVLEKSPNDELYRDYIRGIIGDLS